MVTGDEGLEPIETEDDWGVKSGYETRIGAILGALVCILFVATGLSVWAVTSQDKDPLARQAAVDARHRADAAQRKLNKALNTGYVQEAKRYVDQVLQGYGLVASKYEVVKVDRLGPAEVAVSLKVTVEGQPKPVPVKVTLSRSAWKVTNLE